VPCRRQPSRIGLSLLAAAFVLVPPPARTQTAGPGGQQGDDSLLTPKLDGNPKTPPVFRRPPVQVQAPAAELLPGQLPDYAFKPSLGAGATGFNSSNSKAKNGTGAAGGQDATAQKPNTSAQVSLPPVVRANAIGDARQLQYQNRTRHGAPDAGTATATGANPSTSGNAATANASALVPAPGATPADATQDLPKPLIRRPVTDQAPFDPVGITAGSFRLRPAIEVSGGYDTNPQRSNGGSTPSTFAIVAPELVAASNWSRHELTADLRGSYTAYGTQPTLDRPAFTGKIDGRVDVTSHTRIDLESRLIVATDNPGSPNIQAGLARLPISTDVGETLGLGQRFNRFNVELKGLFDRTTYQNSVFTDGEVESNQDRNFDQPALQLRTEYEASPAVRPFAELDVDRRTHDIPLDLSGFARNSDGRAAKIGSTFELSRILTGQVAFGYLDRNYADPRLPDVKGPTFDASLTWLASALTTVKLTAVTTANESTLAGVSGVFTQEVGVEVDHAFRTWLDAVLRFTGDRDEYVGSPRIDFRYLTSFGLTYKLTRELQLKSEVRHEWLVSNIPSNNYQAYVALLGVRLQR
jgi:hypothetical protein